MNLIMKLCLTVLVCMAISSCATYSGIKTDIATATAPAPVEQSALQVKLTDDLNAAIAHAKLAKDLMAPQRVVCYTTILGLVPDLPVLPTLGGGKAAGVFDAFEIGAEAAENIAMVSDFQIPPEVRAKLLIDCGPLAAAANDLLLKFNLRIARVAGRIGLLVK